MLSTANPRHLVVASDKLFFWLFQERSERLQPLVASLLDDMEGYGFSAPAIKELEVRLDGLFLPPADQWSEKPALILEAQMAGSADFFLRLYSESGLVLRHQQRQGQPIRHWRVVVICPSKDLPFGDPLPVREFLRERVIWIELASDRLPPDAPPLQKALSLLLLPEEQLPATADAVRHDATGTPLAEEVDTVIAAILVARFCTRSIPKICAMGGLTIDDFTSSAVYKEIFGQGRSEGIQEGQREGLEQGERAGRQAEAAALTLRLLQRRCGSLPPQQQARLQALPLSRLEALADALLDFQGPDDLTAWLQANGD
jgi:predicted transposase YdaD